jgi:hypothetical protein
MNILLLVILVIIFFIVIDKINTKEPFYYGGGDRIGRPWFGGDRRFRSNHWRQPYSFYNSYPRWYYNSYIEPAYSNDPVYIVTNPNTMCKEKCIKEFKDEDSELEDIQEVKKCLKKCN